jgi:predicted esterase
VVTTVVLATVFALAAFAAPPHADARSQGTWGVAFAPRDPRAPSPAIVFLHGMWASPEDSCDVFAGAATPFGFLVCPRANAPLRVPVDGRWVDDTSDAGLKMWSGSAADAERSIRIALDAADALAPGERVSGNGTLVGFSNGAYFAAEVACAEPGRWTGLVLLSMKLDLDGARLARAGVTRVVLAAGERDGSSASMRALAAKLEEARKASARAAPEVRYLSLGDVGHTFPPDMGARMCEAITWVRGGSSEMPCTAMRD